MGFNDFIMSSYQDNYYETAELQVSLDDDGDEQTAAELTDHLSQELGWNIDSTVDDEYLYIDFADCDDANVKIGDHPSQDGNYEGLRLVVPRDDPGSTAFDLFLDLGVMFDTGGVVGSGKKEWLLDFSLKGATVNLEGPTVKTDGLTRENREALLKLFGILSYDGGQGVEVDEHFPVGASKVIIKDDPQEPSTDVTLYREAPDESAHPEDAEPLSPDEFEALVNEVEGMIKASEPRDIAADPGDGQWEFTVQW